MSTGWCLQSRYRRALNLKSLASHLVGAIVKTSPSKTQFLCFALNIFTVHKSSQSSPTDHSSPSIGVMTKSAQPVPFVHLL